MYLTLLQNPNHSRVHCKIPIIATCFTLISHPIQKLLCILSFPRSTFRVSINMGSNNIYITTRKGLLCSQTQTSLDTNHHGIGTVQNSFKWHHSTAERSTPQPFWASRLSDPPQGLSHTCQWWKRVRQGCPFHPCVQHSQLCLCSTFSSCCNYHLHIYLYMRNISDIFSHTLFLTLFLCLVQIYGNHQF